MAFCLGDDKGSIKVVVSKDSAIVKNENYDKYLKNLDESCLELSEEPTRFVLRKTLNYRGQQMLMRAQLRQKGKSMEFDLSSVLEQVRLHLYDIENPPQLDKKNHIEFKRGSDNFASEELVAGLNSHGVLMDLFTAIQNAVDTPKADSLAKKS